MAFAPRICLLNCQWTSKYRLEWRAGEQDPASWRRTHLPDGVSRGAIIWVKIREEDNDCMRYLTQERGKMKGIYSPDPETQPISRCSVPNLPLSIFICYYVVETKLGVRCFDLCGLIWVESDCCCYFRNLGWAVKYSFLLKYMQNSKLMQNDRRKAMILMLGAGRWP